MLNSVSNSLEESRTTISTVVSGPQEPWKIKNLRNIFQDSLYLIGYTENLRPKTARVPSSECRKVFVRVSKCLHPFLPQVLDPIQRTIEQLRGVIICGTLMQVRYLFVLEYAVSSLQTLKRRPHGMALCRFALLIPYSGIPRRPSNIICCICA